MNKVIYFLIIFLFFSQIVLSQVSFQTGSYILYLNKKVGPKVTLTLNNDLSKKITLTNYYYASETWGEGLIGFNFKLTPWLQLGAMGGFHSDKESMWRYAGTYAVGTNKLNFNGMYEQGGSDIRKRFRGQILYRMGGFQTGPYAIYNLNIWGLGVRFQYDFKKIPFQVWAIPLYGVEIEQYGIMAGVYYKFKSKPSPQVPQPQPDITQFPLVEKKDNKELALNPQNETVEKLTPEKIDSTSKNQLVTTDEKEEIKVIIDEFEKNKKNHDNQQLTDTIANLPNSAIQETKQTEKTPEIKQNLNIDVYTIQLAAFKSQNNKYSNYKEVFCEQGSDQLFRYYYGKYKSQDEAYNVLYKIKEQKLNGFVTKIKVTDVQQNTKEENIKHDNTQNQDYKYTLQIAASKTITAKLKNIPGVFVYECTDGFYRYFYKKCTTIVCAEEAKIEMQNKGFQGIIKQLSDIERIKIKEL